MRTHRAAATTKGELLIRDQTGGSNHVLEKLRERSGVDTASQVSIDM